MTLEEVLASSPENRYALLDRMRTDCKYYLGNGRRHNKHLWCVGDEQRHIDYMKAIWNSFPQDAKPEWLTMEQILAYERLMIGGEGLNSLYSSNRCPHCGGLLRPSDNPEYTFQCFDCDEDFYTVESNVMHVVFAEMTDMDKADLTNAGMQIDFDQYLRAHVFPAGMEHEAVMYVRKETVDRLGMRYIADHVVIYYSDVCKSWFGKFSENDFHNDLQRNPERVIPVVFSGIDEYTGREVYRGIEFERYYLREVSAREPFAKWYVCGKRRMPDDGDEPKPNLIFQLGNQYEKVTYDDWNGVAAYSATFNPNFRASAQG